MKMYQNLWSALLLGIAAGLSPGPLLALLVFESLFKGFVAGLMIAIVPLFTDGLIAIVCLLALHQLSDSQNIISTISCLGALYLIWLAVVYLRNNSDDLTSNSRHTIRSGFLVNLLNPNPYMFWLTVGGPLVHRAPTSDYFFSLKFVVLFYLGLIGSKICFARVVSILGPGSVAGWYPYLKWVLASFLLIFSLVLFYQALSLLDATL